MDISWISSHPWLWRSQIWYFALGVHGTGHHSLVSDMYTKDIWAFSWWSGAAVCYVGLDSRRGLAHALFSQNIPNHPMVNRSFNLQRRCFRRTQQETPTLVYSTCLRHRSFYFSRQSLCAGFIPDKFHGCSCHA